MEAGSQFLMSYTSAAYLLRRMQVPRMQIFVRDQKVRTQRVTSLLRSKYHERFTPRKEPLGSYADIEMGFNTEVRNVNAAQHIQINPLDLAPSISCTGRAFFSLASS